MDDEATNKPNKFGRTSNAIRTTAMLFGLLGIAGLLGAGLCEHVVVQSPSSPDPVTGHTEVENFKGMIRYVTVGTSQLCVASRSLAAGGVGLGVLLGIALYLFFGRLPHERTPPRS
jgi:hypothetical protein